MPKILVADDNTNIQKMVSLAFEERGIDVVSVGNGEAAVRRIPDMNPDLVLADIFMPVRNGYEVCEFVKKDGRFSHVPVILLVGAFDPLDEKEARRVGADGVLKKPFVPPDPLIAMVISALEKNPKLAAELAKAKEAPAPDPAPLPVLEAPVRAEIKPLPEYPEPESPEEAALVYGIASKSGRDNDDENGEERSPLSADTEAEEQAEHAGSNDWRRNAMDFEVPEETSKNMAFAMDDDSPSAMFPSEKDVPPKHVSPKEFSKPVFAEAATQTAPVALIAPPPVAVAPPVVTTPPNMDHDSLISATMWGAPAAPIVAAPAPVAPKSEPVAVAPEVKALQAKMAEPVAVAKAVEPAAEPELEIESVVEPPTFAARAAHWMDAMTAALKSKDEAEWSDPTPPVKMDLDAPQTVTIVQALASVPQAVVAPEEMPVSQGLTPAEDDAFFAGEAEEESTAVPVVALASKAQTILNDPALESSGPVPVSKLVADPELVVEQDTSGPMAKDPALVEPPSVQVKPEPLLVDETEVAGPSKYDEREAPIAPAFVFTESSAASNGAPAEAAAAEPAAPQAAEAETEIDERIPTGPPPNREILATIPFLTPPPEILAEAAEESKAADVDALVRKVLEKLEPQLHNLLSQGVLKPLVENILQDDLAKKGR